MKKYYLLTEIDFDSSIETEKSLILAANDHCQGFPEREHLLPIDTVEKAINYFNTRSCMGTDISQADETNNY